MHLEAGNGVMPSPARPAEVPEAIRVTAEERSWIDAARTAHRVLQVRVDLHLQEMDRQSSNLVPQCKEERL